MLHAETKEVKNMDFVRKTQKPFEITNNTLEDHEERISEIELELGKIEERLQQLQEQINNLAITSNEAILRLLKLIQEVKEPIPKDVLVW